MLRKVAVAAASKPHVEIRQDGDQFYIKTSTTVRTTEINFKVGEGFEEETVDGRKCRVRPQKRAAFRARPLHAPGRRSPTRPCLLLQLGRASLQGRAERVCREGSSCERLALGSGEGPPQRAPTHPEPPPPRSQLLPERRGTPGGGVRSGCGLGYG